MAEESSVIVQSNNSMPNVWTFAGIFALIFFLVLLFALWRLHDHGHGVEINMTNSINNMHRDHVRFSEFVAGRLYQDVIDIKTSQREKNAYDINYNETNLRLGEPARTVPQPILAPVPFFGGVSNNSGTQTQATNVDRSVGTGVPQFFAS